MYNMWPQKLSLPFYSPKWWESLPLQDPAVHYWSILCLRKDLLCHTGRADLLLPEKPSQPGCGVDWTLCPAGRTRKSLLFPFWQNGKPNICEVNRHGKKNVVHQKGVISCCCSYKPRVVNANLQFALRKKAATHSLEKGWVPRPANSIGGSSETRTASHESYGNRICLCDVWMTPVAIL